MKYTSKQLRDELAAAKWELRRRQREDKAIRRRLVDLNDALGALLGDDGVAPSRQDYATTKSTSGLLLDLEKKQYRLSWKKFHKILQGKPPDNLAKMLFDRADSEYAAKRGRLPGRPDLLLFAAGQVAKLGLPPKKAKVLTEDRAKKHIKQRNRLLDDGYMTVDDFIDPYLNGDVDDPPIDK